MIELYRDGFLLLAEYEEFRLGLIGFKYLLLALIGMLVLVGLLHTFYMLGYNSPLYARRSPSRNWNKQFYPALVMVLAVTVGSYWLLDYWLPRLISSAI